MKPYPAYKDSGAPWLGNVPKHWEVTFIGQIWPSEDVAHRQWLWLRRSNVAFVGAIHESPLPIDVDEDADGNLNADPEEAEA